MIISKQLVLYMAAAVFVCLCVISSIITEVVFISIGEPCVHEDEFMCGWFVLLTTLGTVLITVIG